MPLRRRRRRRKKGGCDIPCGCRKVGVMGIHTLLAHAQSLNEQLSISHGIDEMI